MNTKEIFVETEIIKKNIQEAQEKIEEQRKKHLEVQELCPHEIIFKYRDNRPRKLVMDGRYICPACGKTIQCIRKSQLQETVFSQSRIIPLTHLSLSGSRELHDSIRQEVMDNMDFYYDSTTPLVELERKMEDIIKAHDYSYSNHNKEFQK